MRPLSIGSLPIDGNVIMAPMAGIGDSVFRQIAREHGAALVVTPLISSEGLVRRDAGTLEMTRVREEEGPCAIQIFGTDPVVMARAGRLVEAEGALLIDINAGCPSKRITACGAGVQLLRDLDHLYAVVSAVVQAVSIPVTFKTRLGWSPAEIRVLPAVSTASRAGVASITIHARVKSDGPSAPAQWEWIRRAVQETNVPIVGNGGITSAADAARMVQTTGCAAVMVGRAAVGRPWLLGQCADALRARIPPPDPPLAARVRVALRHVALRSSLDPGHRMVRPTAAVLSAYLRGFPQARTLRPQLLRAISYETLVETLTRVGSACV